MNISNAIFSIFNKNAYVETTIKFEYLFIVVINKCYGTIFFLHIKVYYNQYARFLTRSEGYNSQYNIV